MVTTFYIIKQSSWNTYKTICYCHKVRIKVQINTSDRDTQYLGNSYGFALNTQIAFEAMLISCCTINRFINEISRFQQWLL